MISQLLCGLGGGAGRRKSDCTATHVDYTYISANIVGKLIHALPTGLPVFRPSAEQSIASRSEGVFFLSLARAL